MTPTLDRFLPHLRTSALSARDPRLLMDREGPIEVFYAPLDYINMRARILLVGITPGPTQMTTALETFHRQIAGGATVETAMQEAKHAVAFAGNAFRKNMVGQLDDWGVQTWLKLKSTSSLFGEAAHLMQTASLLHYPVFVGGKPYQGTPDSLGTILLKRHLEYFLHELSQVPDALIFGLGPKVWTMLDKLAARGMVAKERVQNGLFHGSTQNTYRIDYCLSQRSGRAPWMTSAVAYDLGRQHFREQCLVT